MTEEQENLYQHTITNLIHKIDKRDEVIHRLRGEVTNLKKQLANLKEDGCDGKYADNH